MILHTQTHTLHCVRAYTRGRPTRHRVRQRTRTSVSVGRDLRNITEQITEKNTMMVIIIIPDRGKTRSSSTTRPTITYYTHGDPTTTHRLFSSIGFHLLRLRGESASGLWHSNVHTSLARFPWDSVTLRVVLRASNLTKVLCRRQLDGLHRSMRFIIAPHHFTSIPSIFYTRRVCYVQKRKY